MKLFWCHMPPESLQNPQGSSEHMLRTTVTSTAILRQLGLLPLSHVCWPSWGHSLDRHPELNWNQVHHHFAWWTMVVRCGLRNSSHSKTKRSFIPLSALPITLGPLIYLESPLQVSGREPPLSSLTRGQCPTPVCDVSSMIYVILTYTQICPWVWFFFINWNSNVTFHLY